MGKAETVPDDHIIPDRRVKKKGRRYQTGRRNEVRWETDKELRRKNRGDRRKSLRSPWDDLTGT